MKIGIVLGSIRQGRKGAAIAEWVRDNAPQTEGIEVELIDLLAFDVPLLTSGPVPPMGQQKQYDSPAVVAWSQAIDACDGFVFVTAEYNHSVPGAFKNAVDSLGPEWVGKPIAFVSYGADGGVRAVEHWRGVVANFSMFDVRQGVALSVFTEFTEDGFAPEPRRADELATLFDQLTGAVTKLAG